jgi:hypothetical protein
MSPFYLSLIKSFQIFCVTIVIAMVVAVLIKVMVLVNRRLEQPAKKSCRVTHWRGLPSV